VLFRSHFKRISDHYGHPVGDEVIRRIAGAVRKQIRGTDVAARFGGEEFAVLLPETDLFGALTVAGTVHRAISRLTLVLKTTQQRLPNVSVSVGVSCLREDDSPETLVERADQALYVAKRTGRNQVISERQLDEIDRRRPA
jgi:diguanylate cyclase